MDETREDDAVEADGELLLDPFSFFQGVASRITGLGGETAGHDPAYAFHTPYVEAAPGPCNFTVRFSRLAAKYGTLQLRVHMIALEPGATASMANMDRIALNRLVQYGGEFSIKFEGFRGYSFALMGLILGETDAQAENLVVALDRPAAVSEEEVSSDGRATPFGRDATRHVTQLISLDPPSFASPVTQICTQRQLAEPSFREWRKVLNRGDGDDLAVWREAFILQALQRYGMLSAGARGIGLDVRHSSLPSVIAGYGAEVAELTRSEGEERDGGASGPALRRPFDPFPKDLVDFDFAFSTGVLARMGSAKDGLRLLESSMGCLRPGGLMIHTAPMDLGVDMGDMDPREGSLGRADMERMALVAISRNHEVAQIRIDRSGALTDPSRPGEIGAFGMILRRAPSLL